MQRTGTGGQASLTMNRAYAHKPNPMKDKINTPLFSPAGLLASWRALPVLGALALAVSAQAQVLLQEDFTGGASTNGFTIDDTGSDCAWLYAPGGLTNGTFSLDF